LTPTRRIRRSRPGGFTETQAQTLIEALGESRDALATKADIADMVTTADLEALRVATKADLRELELRVDARFESLEQRMTIRLGAMLIAAVALIVTIQGFLLALFLSA
jgi:hypothetical protein